MSEATTSTRPASTTTPTTGGHAYAQPGRDARAHQPRRGAGQLAVVAVLVLSLGGAAVMRHLSMRFQLAHAPAARRTSGGASLAGMDSYALALLLGGLRGPLVMILWANSENQKADRDLEGIDTQIEWIRRLQPEFDSVHIFQMWNKAYNLSVQMVGLANKYTTILDAVDYGRNIDAERPDNLNLLKELGRIYADKLGSANPEKYYYRDRVRRESKYREVTGGAQAGEPGFQRLTHDPLLDPAGNLLPKFLKPRVNVGPSRDNEFYDGSDLQFLKAYQPFPYGVTPTAIGFNYHKRGQVLMSTQKQKPLQISESVVDSQPALTLKNWTEEEFERGRRLEFKLFGEQFPVEDKLKQQMPTAAKPLDSKLADPSVLPELLYSYDLAKRLGGDSLTEYERHLRNPEFVTKTAIYASHMDSMRGMQAMAAADVDYIRAMQASGDERHKLLASATANYRNAIYWNGLAGLRYFTPDRFTTGVFPAGVTRGNVGTGAAGSVTAVTVEDVIRLVHGVRDQMQRQGGPQADENYEDRVEYEQYVDRSVERMKLIEQAAKQP